MVISPPPKKKVILALLRPGMFYGRFGDPRLWGQHLKLLLSGVWIWISSVTMWWRCLSSTINIYLGLIQTHSQNWQFSGPWWFQHIQNHPPRQKPTNPTIGGDFWLETTSKPKALVGSDKPQLNHLGKSSLFYQLIWHYLMQSISYEYVRHGCQWMSWIQDSSNAPNISQHGVSK